MSPSDISTVIPIFTFKLSFLSYSIFFVPVGDPDHCTMILCKKKLCLKSCRLGTPVTSKTPYRYPQPSYLSFIFLNCTIESY